MTNRCSWSASCPVARSPSRVACAPVSSKSLAVFDKPDTPQGPTFPETLLISPARLEPGALAAVLQVARDACAAIGLVEGPVHVECKVNGSEAWFLELAARTIGGLCSRALRRDGGSLEDLVIRHALGPVAPAAAVRLRLRDDRPAC